MNADDTPLIVPEALVGVKRKGSDGRSEQKVLDTEASRCDLGLQ